MLSWILRFCNNCKLPKEVRITTSLTSTELKESLIILIKFCQLESFAHELKLLTSNKSLQSGSNILNLNPFLDSNGLIRVGGRIKNSNFSYDKKFPLLLPKNHVLTRLIFNYFHIKLLHCGSQQLLANIREYYWPLSGRNLARETCHKCLKCFRVQPRTYHPLMGDLISKRLKLGSPVFDNVGLDYAGPILIRDRKLRGSKLIKAYICLFVCLTTRAIHLDLVTELTSNAFIAMLKRFIARRGKPSSISSDNATNFVGASKQLRDIFKFLHLDETRANISNFLANQHISWHFITPYSPHEGGIWESGIKSTKFHLKRVVGNTQLNYEDFLTVLVQIESVLNSRPLSSLSTDPSDLNPLTPGHFLIGRPLNALPEKSYSSVNENRLNKFQRIQKIVQHFWKRWSLEVVPEMQKRTKWFSHLPDLLKKDSLVLIKEENVPPLQWSLARVLVVHRSSDNIVRQATLKTISGATVKRSVHNMCVLPM